jgi:hypothetical protein
MNWSKMSSIAEIVSSVAILLTLAYLAVQTQQNTAAIISDSRQQSLASELELLRMMADYPGTAFGGTTTPEDARRRVVGLAMMRTREHLWLQVRDGQLDEGTFRSYLPPLLAMLSEEDRRQQWNNTGFEPGFRALVDNLLAGNDAQNE